MPGSLAPAVARLVLTVDRLEAAVARIIAIVTMHGPTESDAPRAVGLQEFAPVPVQRCTDEEVRAQLAKLPVRTNRPKPNAAPRDLDIPHTPDDSCYRLPTLDLLDDPELLNDPEWNDAPTAEKHA